MMKRISLAIVAALLLGAAIYSPTTDYLHARHARQLIAALRASDADIPALLKTVDELDSPTQAWVLDQTRYPIQHYFELQAEAAVDEPKGHHDFDAALAMLKEVTPYYPDSAELQQERLSLQMRKATFEAKATPDKAQCSPAHEQQHSVITAKAGIQSR